MTGYRHVIGIIVPSSGIASELSYHKFAPPGVAVATARVKFNRISQADLSEMVGRVRFAAEDISQAGPDVILFGSMLASCGSGDTIRNIVEQHTGVPCITAFSALLDTLRAFSYRRLAVLSALPAELGLLLKTTLLKNGVEQCAVHPLRPGGAAPGDSIRAVEAIGYGELRAAAQALDLSGYDALLFDSSGLQVMDHIPELELLLGLPVLYSEQFTLRRALRSIGDDSIIPALGTIFTQV